jgi:hypothetical protein
MNKIVTLSAALLLTLGLSHASLAQGRGGGGGGPGKHAERGPDDDGGPGKGKGKGNGQGAKGGGQAEMVRGPAERGQGQADRGQGRAERAARPDQVIVRQADRKPERIDRVQERVRQGETRTIVVSRSGDRGLIAGCPPGLAKRNNGCMPPGQERKLARAQYYSLWGRPSDSFSYRYNDGYLYRYDQRGSVLGYLPVLGGALAVGNPWPVQYRYEPVPTYYSRYYGLNDPYDYRYADGALYGVDPRTSSIERVVALLTGQPISVGQRMPVGYDVYNVPYPYRAQYYDSPDRYYRYNDGYVYQVDPTTQLVQAIIQLLT